MERSLVQREHGFEDLSLTSSRVLVVSEDYLLLKHYVHLVRGFGLSPVSAASFAIGLDRVKAETFATIIVDQGGRNFEGRCIVETAVGTARIVVVTRNEDFACRLTARRLGATAYLHHPADGYLERALSDESDRRGDLT